MQTFYEIKQTKKIANNLQISAVLYDRMAILGIQVRLLPVWMVLVMNDLMS